jgi:pyridoxal phosphate-dependent aminotransferase EpsN
MTPPPEPPQILLSAPELGDDERQLVLDALDSNWVAPAGPHIEHFESEVAARVETSHAVALSSGTAAIDLALHLIGVTRGDRVLVPSMTFIGTVGPIVHRGAIPVFIDSAADSWNIDPNLVAETLGRLAAAGELPVAVLPVDLYGDCADYRRLEPICQEYGVPLIEDAAEALGSTIGGRGAGGFGECGVLSFNGNKIITTSAGGMLVTNRDDLAERARYLATQACSPAPHYEHVEVGFNYRMSNVCAALGRAQLRGLDRKVARRRAIHDRYRTGLSDLSGVSFMAENSEGASNRWLTVALIDPAAAAADREKVRRHLADQRIEARPAWKPMHCQPVFAAAEVVGGGVCERLFRDALCLPSGSGLSDDEIDRVITEVRSVLRP